jgi:hypothetical protein
MLIPVGYQDKFWRSGSIRRTASKGHFAFGMRRHARWRGKEISMNQRSLRHTPFIVFCAMTAVFLPFIVALSFATGAFGQDDPGTIGKVLTDPDTIAQRQEGHDRASQQANARRAARDQEQKYRVDEARRKQQQADYAKIDAQSQPNPNPPPLHRAAAQGALDEVKALVGNRADVNEHDPVNGWTPLDYAASSGSIEVVRYLVEQKANVNLGSGKGKFTPLFLAILNGEDSIAEVLIAAGANVNAQTSFGGPLHAAARILDSDGAKLLLANGASPEAPAAGGATPTEYAGEGKERALAAAHAAHPLTHPQLVPIPTFKGETCPQCNGTGRLSGPELQNLVSAVAAQNVNTPASIKIDPTCRKCGGTGRLFTAEQLRQVAAAQAARQQQLAEFDAVQAESDKPLLELHQGIVSALEAFSRSTSDSRAVALKRQIIAEYQGLNWHPPAKEQIAAGSSPDIAAHPLSTGNTPAAETASPGSELLEDAKSPPPQPNERNVAALSSTNRHPMIPQKGEIVVTSLATTDMTFTLYGDGRAFMESKAWKISSWGTWIVKEGTLVIKSPDGHFDSLKLGDSPNEISGSSSRGEQLKLILVEKKAAPPPSSVQHDPSPASGTVRIVIWNTHNFHYRDRGTEVCNLILFDGERKIWSKDDVQVPWQADAPSSASIDVPAARFDRLRVEITRCHGRSAGLAEIQIFRGDTNIAQGCRATTDGHYDSGGIKPENVTDGVTTDSGNGKGYWLHDKPTGWIEVHLDAHADQPAEATPDAKTGRMAEQAAKQELARITPIMDAVLKYAQGGQGYDVHQSNFQTYKSRYELSDQAGDTDGSLAGRRSCEAELNAAEECAKAKLAAIETLKQFSPSDRAEAIQVILESSKLPDSLRPYVKELKN